MFGLIGVLSMQIYNLIHIENDDLTDYLNQEQETNIIVEEEKKVEIFNGNTRPIAVMIDNVGSARPQAGLNDAYMVYEIIVEGQLTRLMAVFKDVDLEKIGPIRSSRHYFLDYALENDAIYVHFGWSPQAQTDIRKLGVDNINGMSESSKSFWRVKDKSAPHNAVTSTEKIMQIAKRKKYDTTSEKESVLNYVTEEVELESNIIATDITIPYSSTYKVTYKYDEETKRYTRGYNKTTQKDWVTKELVTTKNIIITFAKNNTLNDGSGKNRQNLLNVGTLDGYYITNGKAIKIKCYKSSRKAQTVYKDLEGNEINVNDGNTFVQIVPINSKVVIEGEKEVENK
jgi:hypothetical protein